MRDPSALHSKYCISLGCGHLCTDGRLYTILHKKEAVYIVHGVYRPYERPLIYLGGQGLKRIYFIQIKIVYSVYSLYGVYRPSERPLRFRLF